jgi:hypothetical protein
VRRQLSVGTDRGTLVGAEVGGTYNLREQSEAYGDEFASENETLMPDNTIPWEKIAETTET